MDLNNQLKLLFKQNIALRALLKSKGILVLESGEWEDAMIQAEEFINREAK